VGPTAAFSSVATGLSVAFNGSGSSDPDGTITGYAWDFGDGSSGVGVSPVHAYATAGTYSVTLTVTDDDNATGTRTGSVTVTAGPAPALAADTFSRTVSNGWGTADTGGAWTISGTASAFAVNNGSGVIGGGVGTYLTGVSTNDVDLTTDATLSVAATGGGAYLSVIARRVGTADYRAKLRYSNDNRVSVYLNRAAGNTETVLTWVTIPNLTVTPGDTLRVRVQATGTGPTTIRVKVWRASTTEPTAWLLTTTDSTAALQNPGHIGFLLYTSSSWTGTAPTSRIDNLTARTP
jgi:PKD repeat protein